MISCFLAALAWLVLTFEGAGGAASEVKARVLL
jgi:hypothetical protein